MSLEQSLKKIAHKCSIEIYNQAKLKFDVKINCDYGQINFRDYSTLKFLSSPVPLENNNLQFSTCLTPVTSELSCYDLVIANDVLAYSENILLSLKNCFKMLQPEGHLLIAYRDKRYSRDCLRNGASFPEALGLYLGNIDLGYLAFDVAYNTCAAYDTPSFWHSANGIERDGLSYDEALCVWQEVKNGKKYYFPYWVFTEKSFLFFLRELINSKILLFSLEAVITVKEYEDMFYVLLKSRMDLSNDKEVNYLIKEQTDKINQLIKIYVPDGITLKGDGEDYLRKQLKIWQKEYADLSSIHRGYVEEVQLQKEAFIEKINKLQNQ